MKKVLFVLFCTVLIGCSSSDESSIETTSTEPTPPELLSQYECKECIDFLKFNQSNKTFLNYLISKGYDLNSDSKISCSEALLVINLDLEDNGYVTNLEGIEYLKNLKRLSGFIKIPDTYLTGSILNLYNNYNLEELNLNQEKHGVNNGVNYIEKGWIHTLVLPKNSTLKVLNCPSTTITKVLNTLMQSNLELIDFKGSKLTGEFDLSNSNKLKSIDFTYNTGLSSVTFSDINNPNLISLKIGTTNIDLGQNYLSTISTSTFPNLQTLDLSYNSLTKIDVTKNKQLKYLNITRNKILNLNVLNNNLLETLGAGGNLISNIDVSNLTNLKHLSLSNNLLDNLDLTSNPNLLTVYLTNNDLENLNLKNGNNRKIIYMQAQQNKIDCIKIDNGFTPNINDWLKDSKTKYCN
jgi:hypothetical protein